MKLASATDFATGAVRVQTEQNEIATNLLELSEKAHISLADATTRWGDAVSKAITTADEGKALTSLNEQFAKSIQQMQDHAREAFNMGAAIQSGGKAVLDAEAQIAAAPLMQEIEQLQNSMANAAKTLGTNSTAYQTLAASLQRAKDSLTAFQQASEQAKQADYTKELASGYDSLRSKIQSLQIEGSAIGGTTEQLRQAAVAAQLAEYTAAHPGLDTGSDAWKSYADEVERASKAEQQNADASAALKYNLGNAFTQAIADLEKYRQQLEAVHASTIAIDAAEGDAAKNTIKSYDDLLLKTGSLKDGMQAFFNQIALDAKTPAQQIFDVFNNAYNSIQDSLTRLVLGQKNALRDLGKSLEESVTKSLVQNGTQKLTSGLGNLLGFHLGGGKGSGKPDGSSSHSALWVQDVNSAKKLAGVVGGKSDSNDSQSTPSAKGSIFGTLTSSFRDIGSKLGDTFKNVFSGLGGIFSKLLSGGGGGFGSLLGSLGSMFGGFRADGGSVSPGYSYTVGERGPERFVPQAAGRIVPNVSSAGNGNQRPIQVQAHFHGVTDADTFKASKTMILNNLANAVGRAAGRR